MIGGGLSALDLSIEIASTATTVFAWDLLLEIIGFSAHIIYHLFNVQVLFSHQGQPFETCWLPENVRQVGKVTEVTTRGIVLDDGEESQVDCIVLCTGD